jgi:hypothetical protein
MQMRHTDDLSKKYLSKSSATWAIVLSLLNMSGFVAHAGPCAMSSDSNELSEVATTFYDTVLRNQEAAIDRLAMTITYSDSATSSEGGNSEVHAKPDVSFVRTAKSGREFTYEKTDLEQTPSLGMGREKGIVEFIRGDIEASVELTKKEKDDLKGRVENFISGARDQNGQLKVPKLTFTKVKPSAMTPLLPDVRQRMKFTGVCNESEAANGTAKFGFTHESVDTKTKTNGQIGLSAKDFVPLAMKGTVERKDRAGFILPYTATVEYDMIFFQRHHSTQIVLPKISEVNGRLALAGKTFREHFFVRYSVGPNDVTLKRHYLSTRAERVDIDSPSN